MTFKNFVIASTIVMIPAAGFAASEEAVIESTGNMPVYSAPDTPMVPVATDGSAFPEARHLTVVENVCARDKADIIDWAANTEGYASMAVPTLPAGVEDDCSIQNPDVVTGVSNQFDSFEKSDKLALDMCNANLLDGYGECVVIAQVTDMSNIEQMN